MTDSYLFSVRAGTQPKTLLIRYLLIGLATGSVLLAACASAGAAFTDEWLPQCEQGQTTNCVSGVQLNGAPTAAIRANVTVKTPDAASDPVGAGTSVVVFFVRPEPVTWEPCPPGPQGGSCRPAMKNCTGRRVEGPGNVAWCSNITDLAPPGSKVGVTVNIGANDPKVAWVRGAALGNLAAPNRSWTLQKTPEGNVLTAEVVQETSSFIDGPDYKACIVFPVANDCGGPNAVADWTGSWLVIGFYDWAGPTASARSKEFGELARGMTIATNVQANGPLIFDPEKRSLSFQTGGPHFQQDGTTPNQGFLYTFLPDTFLEAGPGFGLPPGLSPKETLAMLGIDKITAGSATEQLEPTVTDVNGGVIYSVAKFGFSSPKFDYLRRKAAGAFTSKATATRKNVSVTLEVGGKSKVGVTGKLGSKAICTGSRSASMAGAVTIPCRLSSKGRKALSNAKTGSRVNVKVTVKGAKTETKNTYALIP